VPRLISVVCIYVDRSRLINALPLGGASAEAAGAIGQSGEAALSPDGYQLGETACVHADERAGSTGGTNGCTGHKLAGIKSQIVAMDTLALVRRRASSRSDAAFAVAGFGLVRCRSARRAAGRTCAA
jgi:hypothetical protein